MHGYVHVILKDFILHAGGQETWWAVLKELGPAWDEESLLEHVMLEDSLTYSLMTAAFKSMKMGHEEAMIKFGAHFAHYALRSGNASFLKAQGATLPAFMANINTMHHRLERDNPSACFPFVEVDYDPEEEEAVLTYLSAREGCAPMVVGALTEIGKRLYGVDVHFQSAEVPEDLLEAQQANRAAAWRVRWTPRPDGPLQTELLPKTERLSFWSLHSMLSGFSRLCCSAEKEAEPAERVDPVVPEVVSQASTRKLNKLEGKSEEEARKILMRGARASQIAASWTDRSLMRCRPYWESAHGRGKDYDISEDVRHADAFLSHSWCQPHDWETVMGPDVSYADFKATTLALMAKDIALEKGDVENWGTVKFWVDKFCIPQDNPELKTRCIQLIEHFMSRCAQFYVIFTWTYLERLWCVFEWASFLVDKDPCSIHLEVEFFMKVETLPLYLDAVRNFSHHRAQCTEESDRAILEAKIAQCYVSTRAFEELVRITVVALVARSMAYCAGRSRRLRRMFFDPWVDLAEELHFVDLARALRGSRPEEWCSEAAMDETPSSSGPRTPGTPSSPMTPGVTHSVSASKYRGSINDWFAREVGPILRRKRGRAVQEVIEPFRHSESTSDLSVTSVLSCT